MTEVLEYGQGLLPGVAARAAVAGGVGGVAKAVQCAGFFIAVAEVAEQAERSPVAVDGLVVVAEVVVGAAEPVQCRCRAPAVTGFLVKRQSKRAGAGGEA